MRILLLVTAFNALSQRLFVELGEQGHEVSIEIDVNDARTIEAVELFEPDLVVAPYLKRAIPARVYENRTCVIVHPGIVGDRGPSALDWAMTNGETEWGVTVLEAVKEMDAGPVWASAAFPMRRATKSSLYRNEATEAAVTAVLEAVERLRTGVKPVPADELAVPHRGCWRDAIRQADRQIDWMRDTTETVIGKIAAADGVPGVRDELFGEPAFLFDARQAFGLPVAAPGAAIARSGPAIARATVDGAVWIGHVRRPGSANPFKLPATLAFAPEAEQLPERPLNSGGGYQDIAYEEQGAVGFLHFPFYNGAMGTDACGRLLDAYHKAAERPTKVIVLCGGPEFWSNGLDLNRIEAAVSPADESYANICAIDDLSEAIISTTSHVTVSALGGNAGAGGVFLARGADHVWLRSGVILNPHYKDMGNLYGSEFWTYLLPRHCGADNARRIAAARLPMGTREGLSLGLADRILPGPRDRFAAEVKALAAGLADRPDFPRLLAEKQARRAADEAAKPLSEYREEELARMRRNFYGFDPSYHVARHNFVHKVPKSRTPVTIARHRDLAWASGAPGRRRAS
ncbi:hydrogenase maturation protein [Mesorhizobium sp. M1E.F.Ca.ET.045.02.1.1]|uniref:hydrogenase maturation protein n=1 Tax=Mesorhizobium sp. M1E.F.Ca.ET.045.02.1.1 TaxID=2493672 RepID=UPI000F75B0A0|nr:hydrogenase maturation protein [Mesorhizobium sp. M1E.F.Ca.ET.045.02.1.1]AZO25509.1 hydrogenase maturation protein [Mesorhizobium sp. M1E.F.Ca.ET.045.02.1.1]